MIVHGGYNSRRKAGAGTACSRSAPCRGLAGFPRFRWTGPVVVLTGSFIPAKGFSCSRHTMPCLGAMRFISSIISWLWSVALFAPLNTGASSCCPGATSNARFCKHAQLPQLPVQLRHDALRGYRACRNNGRPAPGFWRSSRRKSSCRRAQGPCAWPKAPYRQGSILLRAYAWRNAHYTLPAHGAQRRSAPY